MNPADLTDEELLQEVRMVGVHYFDQPLGVLAEALARTMEAASGQFKQE